MPIYTYANIKSAVNGRLHNKIGKLTDPRTSINNSVHRIQSIVPFRSSKRKALLAPNLFQDEFQYTCPTDLMGYGIISLQRQTPDRPKTETFDLTTEDEFDRRKSLHEGLVAFTDRDFTRKLLISTIIDDKTLVVSTFDSTTAGGGTWTVNGDATNLIADSDNFIEGNGSLKFDLNSGGTTAGLQNSALNTFDITNYKNQGSVFVWVYITTTSGVTSFTIRIGSSTSNYYSQTVITTNEGLAFQAGWNLLRFDLNGATQTGTVTKTACNYVNLFMTKTVGKVSDTDYRFDGLLIKRGKFYNLIYYSKYPWQTAAGVYIENSTADTDLLNVDTDEYNLIIEACVEDLGLEARENADSATAQARLGAPLGTIPPRPGLIPNYQSKYPSEALLLTTTYHDFASIDGDDRQFGGER
jgi:hypothetical protein